MYIFINNRTINTEAWDSNYKIIKYVSVKVEKWKLRVENL